MCIICLRSFRELVRTRLSELKTKADCSVTSEKSCQDLVIQILSKVCFLDELFVVLFHE